MTAHEGLSSQKGGKHNHHRNLQRGRLRSQ